MLVLGRKENESIVIGDNIRITILGRSGATVRIGIEAPRDISVVRAELIERDAPKVCDARSPARMIAATLPIDSRAAG